MADLIIGLLVVGFVFLGVRDGFARSLGGVITFFLALFASAAVIEFFSAYSPVYKDYLNIATVMTFIFVWLVTLVILELLLGLLLKRIITVTVLGPVDRVLGGIVGGGRGLLVLGLALQLALALAIPAAFKTAINEAFLAKLSISAYQWAFPLAKKTVPQINQTMRENIINKIHVEIGDLSQDNPDELKKKLVEVEKAKARLEKELLKFTPESETAPKKGELNEILRNYR
ncbi:MAG: CvpA family protein [Candidatus Margulisiibacteriota bacterium]|jgi:membrane protein required for colicin V production